MVEYYACITLNHMFGSAGKFLLPYEYWRYVFQGLVVKYENDLSKTIGCYPRREIHEKKSRCSGRETYQLRLDFVHLVT